MCMRKKRGGLPTLFAGFACLAVFLYAWTRRDDIHALMSKDFAARRDVLRLVESRRTPEHRERFRIAVPEAGGEFPSSFEVRLYGRYAGDSALLAIESVEAEQPVLRFNGIKGGLFQGVVPGHVLDSFLRKRNYLVGLREEEIVDDGIESGGGGIWIEHYPDYVAEVEVTDPGNNVDVHRSRGQANSPEIEADMNLAEFVHTWTCEEIKKIARDWLKPIENLQAREEVIIGFLEKVETKPGQEDRDSILADIYSHLAADWAIAKAMPSLRRLAEDLNAERLEITTATDPCILLEKAIFGADRNGPNDCWRLAAWATDFMAESVRPEWRREVLCRCLPDVRHEQVKGLILEDLGEFARSCEAAEALRNAFSSANQDPLTRTVAAGSLLRVSGNRGAYEFLVAKISEPGEREGELGEAKTLVIKSLVAFAEREEPARSEVARILRPLFTKFPGYTGLLIEGLGRLGRPDDESLIEKFHRRRGSIHRHEGGGGVGPGQSREGRRGGEGEDPQRRRSCEGLHSRVRLGPRSPRRA